MMEHRWDARIDAPMNVVVHVDGGAPLKSLAHNISRGGIFIELGDLENIRDKGDLEKKKVVLVEFNEDQFSATLPALILRCSAKNAALMFITHPPAFRPFLERLIW